MSDRTSDRTPDLTAVVIYPELLDLYADRGNAVALRHRAALHGLGVDIVDIHPGDPIPSGADFYLLGGAEDNAMIAAMDLLRHQSGLAHAVARGAPILGVCGGFQLLGSTFEGPDGQIVTGLGHLDIVSRRLPEARAVGEVLATSARFGELQGFENHRGDAHLGPDAAPLGTIVQGIGNGDGETEGAVQGTLIGTYLHGPVLVRNPALTDLILSLATGRDLPPVSDPLVEELRVERHQEVARHRHHLPR